jgi:anti-sigma28 factor (negative regulator of flagellin synthesis)
MQMTSIESEKTRKTQEEGPSRTYKGNRPKDKGIRPADRELYAHLVKQVMSMGDREDLIARVRERITSGSYRPTSEEIIASMIHQVMVNRIK